MKRNFGFVGVHLTLLAAAISMLALQRYLWQLKLAAQGYGPYMTVSYLVDYSAFFVLIDLLLLGWSLRSSENARILSLAWPLLFFVGGLYVLVGNNV